MSIERIAVLGAGIMGRGIAYAATISGFETRLYDALPAALDKGKAEILGLMEKGVSAGKRMFLAPPVLGKTSRLM